MKNQQNITIQQYCRLTCVLTAAAALVLGILRAVLTKTAFDQPLPYGITLGAAGVLLVVILAVFGLENVRPIKVIGRMAQVSAAGAALAGATLVVFSVVTAQQWFAWRVMPYPSKGSVSGLDTTFLYLLIAAGLAGGVFFLLLAVRWWRFEQMTGRFIPLLALTPVLWSWIRLLRYITSHVSSLGLFRNVYDLGMIVFETLFFVLLARYVSGTSKKASRFFLGVSLCTGLLCTISGITQIGSFLAQEQAVFDTCALVISPDLGMAVFAFATAFAQSFGTAGASIDLQEEPREMIADDFEDGQGAEFLLSDQWFAVYDAEEDEGIS
ncbi:MAG: hypothetical protein IKU56_03845 [Clostridia bacterium]|nr:hypothetical protein [Clostridia bacterium]